MPPSAGINWRSYLVALLVASGVLLLTASVPFLRARPLLMLPLTAVVISAWYGGLGPGLVATFVSAVGLTVFLFPPEFSLLVESENSVRLALFIISSVAIAVLSEARLRAVDRAERSQRIAEAAASRSSRLAELTAALSDAVTPAQVAEVIITGGLATIGADRGGVGMLSRDGTRFEILRRFGYASGQPNPSPLAVDKLGIAGVVLDTEQPLFLASQAELEQRYPHLAGDLPSSADGAVAALPLMIEGKAIGVMAARFKHSHSFDATETAYLSSIAHQCAQALHRARLYEDEKAVTRAAERAAERLQRLQAVTAALSQAVTMDEVADVIISQGLLALGAQGGVLALLVAEGREFELIRIAGYPGAEAARRRRFSTDVNQPIAEAVRGREIVIVVGSDEAARRYPGFAVPGYGFCAWAATPLLAKQGAVGALGFAFAELRAFSSDDISLLQTLGEQCAQALERARLYEEELTARERSETAQRQLEFVARVNVALSFSMDYPTRLERLAQLLIPTLGDGCVVRVTGAGGNLETAAFAHVDPARAPALAEALSAGEPGGDPARSLYDRLASGETILLPDERQVKQPDPASEAEGQPAIHPLYPQSIMVVPLLAFGRFLGAVTLYLTESERRYNAADVDLAERVLRRAAIALDNAHLYELEREAHATAEQATVRVRRLQTVTEALSQATSLDEVAEAIIHAGATALNADGGLLALLTPEGSELEVVASQGYPSHATAEGSRLALTLPRPLADAVRKREVVTIESPEVAAAHYPTLADAQAGLQAWVAVPLVAADHLLGAIAFAFAAPRRFSVEDQTFLRTLGEQCAQAIERARLYEAEQEARTVADTVARRISLLYDASSRLAEGLDLDEVVTTLAHLVVPAVADWCTIDMVTTGHWATQFFVSHVDPEKEAIAREMTRRFPPQPAYAPGLNEVLTHARPIFVSHITPEILAQRTKNAEHLAMVQRIGPTSYTILPLVARGQLLGTMSLAMTEGRGFEPADLEVAQELARRAAVFVDNARLYQEARDAMAARQAILAVVSHDLKNPLAVIKGYAALIERAARHLDDSTSPRILDRVKRIDSVTMRMNSMIEELADFSRIQIGQPLNLELELGDLAQLTQQVVEEQRQTTKAHTIHLDLERPRLFLDLDTAKMARVLTNIVGNALKYSPEGGRVDVRVAVETQAGDDWAVVTVTDEGLGIPPEDLPAIFEFYRRGSNIPGRVKGAGIGLAMADYVVKQHGGRIEVTSEVGGGSAFAVYLPLRSQ